MSVIQVSVIQIRHGDSADLPNPSLRQAEFGFNTDDGRLFIGSPDLPLLTRTHYPYLNTEILTEHSHSVDIIKYTKPNGVKRSLREYLDQTSTVLDYGADPSGVQDSSVAFQTAVLDLALSQMVEDPEGNLQPGSRIMCLNIPSGVYALDHPIYVPSRLKLVGDGNVVLISHADVAFVSVSSSWNLDKFRQRISAELYTDLNIVEPIVDVEFRNFALRMSKPTGHAMHLTNCRRTKISGVNFATVQNPKLFNDFGPDAYQYQDSTGIIVSSNMASGDVDIVDCVFDNWRYGVALWGNVSHIAVRGCDFGRAFVGVLAGEHLPAGDLATIVHQGNAQYIQITQCVFRDIHANAIRALDAQHIFSNGNSYVRVGGGLQLGVGNDQLSIYSPEHYGAHTAYQSHHNQSVRQDIVNTRQGTDQIWLNSSVSCDYDVFLPLGTVNLGTHANPWSTVYSLQGLSLITDGSVLHNVAPLGAELLTVMDILEPKSWRFDNSAVHWGYVAQDVVDALMSLNLPVEDYAVVDNQGIVALRYNNLLPLLHHYVKHKFTTIQTQLADVQSAIENINQRLDNLENP